MRFYSLIVLCVLTIPAFAQTSNVTYRNDTVYYKAKPYCILKELKLTDKNSDFSLRNTANTELAYIKYDKPVSEKPAVYKFTFKQSGNEATLNTDDKNAIPRLIVSSELVKDGSEIDLQREEAFVTNNGGTPKKAVAPDYRFRVVVRDKTMPIVVIGDNITQETAKIGSVKEGGQYINKIFMKQLSVYLPDGQKVAEVSYSETNASSAHVMTIKDNKEQDVQINPTTKPRKQVLEWLVRNGYL